MGLNDGTKDLPPPKSGKDEIRLDTIRRNSARRVINSCAGIILLVDISIIGRNLNISCPLSLFASLPLAFLSLSLSFFLSLFLSRSRKS
jgi:hypothetical protein